MIIIGEKLNSSIPSTLAGLRQKSEEFVTQLALKQQAAGADFLDINTGMCEDEAEMLIWTANLVQKAAKNCKLMPDSTNPDALRALFDAVSIKGAIINSVTLEDQRLRGILPIVKEFETGVVAMPIDADGIPKNAAQRVNNTRKIIDVLRNSGMSDDQIYVDIVVEAVATDWESAKETLQAVKTLRDEFPHVHLLAGLSNVSFGLPMRGVINASFLSCAMMSGLDAAIMDITNQNMKMSLFAALMLMGQDEYCGNYLSAYRQTQE